MGGPARSRVRSAWRWRLPSVAHQAGVTADPVPLGDLVGLQVVPVLGAAHVVQGEELPAAGRLEDVEVGGILGAVLNGLDAPGVVGIRGLFQVFEPVGSWGRNVTGV